MPAIISVTNLTKKFKDITAVDGLSFTVNEGDVYGFLGQNGAGKSTLIKIIAGELNMDKGDVILNGTSYAENKEDRLRKAMEVAM